MIISPMPASTLAVRWFIAVVMATALLFSLVTPYNVGAAHPTSPVAVHVAPTPPQQSLLDFAFDVAKADGFKKPQWLPGIIWQESKAGTGLNWRVTGDREKHPNLGVAQVTFQTAKAAVLKYPTLWTYLNTKTDEELKARLIVDDKFNVRVASKIVLMAGINKDEYKAITVYNRGIGGAQAIENPAEFGYTRAVASHAERFKNVKARAVGLKLESPSL